MYYKKLSILLLTVFAGSLYGMDDDKFYKESEEVYAHDEDEMEKKQVARQIFKKYKQEYMDWKWQGFLASEEYWKPLKKGMQNGAIQHSPISNAGQKIGFLSCIGPVQNGNQRAILMLQSVYWMFAWLNTSDPVVSEIYAISSHNDLSFSTLGFLQIDKSLLPKGLEVHEEYLPGWPTDNRLALYCYDYANNGVKDWESKFQELKNSEQELINNAKKYNHTYKELVLEWQKKYYETNN